MVSTYQTLRRIIQIASHKNNCVAWVAKIGVLRSVSSRSAMMSWILPHEQVEPLIFVQIEKKGKFLVKGDIML